MDIQAQLETERLNFRKPVEPKAKKDMAPAFAWTGIANAFIRAGFKEVKRRSPTRPIMRLQLR